MDYTQIAIKAVIGGLVAVGAKLSIAPVADWQTLAVAAVGAFILGAVNVINQMVPMQPISSNMVAANKIGTWTKIRRAL